MTSGVAERRMVDVDMGVMTRAIRSPHGILAGRSRPIQIVATPGSGNGRALATALQLRKALRARRHQANLTVFSDLGSLRRWAAIATRPSRS